MEYGLLGEKLGHSFSPQIHRALAGYDYRLLPTPPEEVEPLRAMVTEAMEGVVDLKVPLLVDVTVGSNWSEAH